MKYKKGKSYIMAEFRLLPVSAEDYDALNLGADKIIESYVSDEGSLVIRAIDAPENYICDGDCAGCPLCDAGCGLNCPSCSCYVNFGDKGFCGCGGIRFTEQRRKEGNRK
jgi:hypothetical protein